MSEQISLVPRTEAADIVRSTKIVAISRKHLRLAPSEILKASLQPRFHVQLEGINYWLSAPYRTSTDPETDSHIAISALVGPSEEDTTLKSYYLSNSQGIWRYLPYTRHDSNGVTEHFGKGYWEDSCNLDLVLQESLAKISSQEDIARTSPARNRVFVGSANSYRTKIEGILAQNRQVLRDSRENPQLTIKDGMWSMETPAYKPRSCEYVQVTDPEPTRLNGNFYGPIGVEDPKPEAMYFQRTHDEFDLARSDKPDFSGSLSTWTQGSPLYGEVQVKVFKSHNGKYSYMFCTDQRERVWVGGVEAEQYRASESTLGIKREWVYLCWLGTPAFEYTTQTRGYGNPRIHSGRYVDMFANYHSKIPIIQEYLATQ